MPHTRNSDQVRDMLKRAGLSQNSELTDEQRERAEGADPRRSAETLRRYIMEGDAPTNGRAKSGSPEARTARVAWELAARKGDPLGGYVTAGQALAVIDAVGRRDVLHVLGDISERALTQFVQGQRDALKPQHRAALRELTARAVSDMPHNKARQLWGRKVAAVALAIHKVRAAKRAGDVLDAPAQSRPKPGTTQPGQPKTPPKPTPKRAGDKRASRGAVLQRGLDAVGAKSTESKATAKPLGKRHGITAAARTPEGVLKMHKRAQSERGAHRR